jgi:hypothetical protein
MPNKKTIAVAVGTIIGMLIATYMEGGRAENFVLIASLILVPFLVVEARFGFIGLDALGLGFGALVGAVIGTMRGDNVLQSITGALTGTGLAAIAASILRSVGLQKGS